MFIWTVLATIAVFYFFIHYPQMIVMPAGKVISQAEEKGLIFCCVMVASTVFYAVYCLIDLYV